MAVPKERESLSELECFSKGEAAKVSIVSGITERRIAPCDKVCSDYSIAAAEALLEELNWSKDSVDLIIYVPTARDYVEPNTANIIQDKLGLSEECLSIDQPMACSGFLYALSTACSYLQNGQLKRALIIAGDTQSKLVSYLDKTLWPITGDAVTVTAIEYDINANPIEFLLRNDGAGAEAIIAPASGVREQISSDTLKMKEISSGIIRNKTHIAMDGLAVFSFAISKPIKAIYDLCHHYNINLESIDYLLLHQANKMIDEKIRKKLKIPVEKVPYSINEYGNSSSGTIPVTMVSRLADQLKSNECDLLMCGFGAGLSWGVVHLRTNKISILPIIEI